VGIRKLGGTCIRLQTSLAIVWGILLAIRVGAWGVSVLAVKPVEPDEAISAHILGNNNLESLDSISDVGVYAPAGRPGSLGLADDG
jgi:hypothetical protein